MRVEVGDEALDAGEELDGGPGGVLEAVAFEGVVFGVELDVGEEGEEVRGGFTFRWWRALDEGWGG